MKNKKNSKDADFIELDKSEFKNKNFVYWKIFIIITLLMSVYFLFKDGKLLTSLKDIFFINNNKEFSKAPVLNNKVEYLTDTEIMGLFQERDLDYQIINNQTNDIKEKINSLEIQINNLKKKLKSLPIQKNIDSSYESDLATPTRAYLNLLLLNKKLLSNDLLSKELEFLKSHFSKNKKIIVLLEYIESIEEVPLNNFELITELDSLARKFSFAHSNVSDQILSDSSWQEAIKSKDNFKKNLMNFIDANFKIRKIDQDIDLSYYSDADSDGKIEITNSLIETRSKLLLNDLRGAKTAIEGISSPLTYDLNEFLEKIEG